MPDTVRFEEIQSLFAKLTAAFEDTAGVGANGQAAATIDRVRRGYAYLAKPCAQLSELKGWLEAHLQ
jgi:hypothetical protein